jgi:hypothetical protein
LHRPFFVHGIDRIHETSKEIDPTAMRGSRVDLSEQLQRRDRVSGVDCGGTEPRGEILGTKDREAFGGANFRIED